MCLQGTCLTAATKHILDQKMAEHLQDQCLSSDVPISPQTMIKVLNTLSGQTMLRPAAAEISTAFMYKGWSKVTHGI